MFRLVNTQCQELWQQPAQLRNDRLPLCNEFAIYNTALSEARVLSHFAETGLAPDLSLTINQDAGSMVLENISGDPVVLNDPVSSNRMAVQ